MTLWTRREVCDTTHFLHYELLYRGEPVAHLFHNKEPARWSILRAAGDMWVTDTLPKSREPATYLCQADAENYARTLIKINPT